MRYKRPDRKNATSILAAAERDMKYTLSLKCTTDSGATIVRNIYECFRMLGEALLVAKGIESLDHVAPIQELLGLSVNTTRPIRVIDTLRILRHNVNYYGYNPSEPEVQDTLSIAKACFPQLLNAVRKMTGK